ncbi:MAG: hypothetical protein JXA64_00190 [Candidatus Fermentibacteraceae bacterium]|nr:hypothetical protein [Candidatus Fermentibacteraceae bacterium]
MIRTGIQVTLVIFAITVPVEGGPAAGAGPGSQHPDDALMMAGELAHYLQMEPIVSLSGPDSAIVVFVALGGHWSGDDGQWDSLVLISSYAVYLDLLREWELGDVAVSFGDSWCRITPEGLLSLSDRELEHADLLEAFRAITEVRSMGEGVE